MHLKLAVVASIAVNSAQPAAAQQNQPNFMFIAQALDRCMTTYAVRLSKTAASDEEIYTEATTGCAPLNAKLTEGITATVPPQQAAEFLKDVDASKKRNFLNMLAKIRNDHAKREGGPTGQ